MKKSELAKKRLMEFIKRQRQGRELRLPPERSLALELGYSRSTVVKVLGELESEGMICRKVGSGTYIRTGTEALPRFTVAIGMRNVFYRSDEHFRLIVETVSAWARQHGISIQIFDGLLNMFASDPEDNALLRAIRSGAVNGVLITSRLPLAIIGRLSVACPCVAINNIFGDGSEIPCVSCDYFRVGFLAGKFLLEQRHRHIAYLTDELNHPESMVELSGFQAALELGGVTFRSDNILETRINSLAVCDRIEAFFRGVPYTGCFIRRMDRLATLVLGWEKIGLDWHEKLQIIGSGNYRHIDRRSWNVNIIDNRLEDMCRMGLETLTDSLHGKKKPETGLVLLPPRLIAKRVHSPSPAASMLSATGAGNKGAEQS